MSFSLLFPRFAFTFLGSFVSLLLATVVAAGGGSSLDAPTTITSAPLHAPAPSPIQAVAGPTADLSADVAVFSIAVTTDRSHGVIDVFSDPGILKRCAGRLSAQIIGQLSVSFVVLPAADATTFFLSGAIALRGKDVTCKNVESVARLPTAQPVSVTALGSLPIVLDYPPAIQREVIITQIIGHRPKLYYAFNKLGVSQVTIMISGSLNLSGIGEVDF